MPFENIIRWFSCHICLTILDIGIKLSNLIQKKIASLTKDFQGIGGKVNSSLIEYLQGIEEIKSYHANDFFYGKVEDMILNQQLKVANSMSVNYSFYLLVNAFLAYALPALIVILGVILVLKGEMTLGSILALYALSQQIQEPIRMITEMSQQKETSQQMEGRNSFLLEKPEKKKPYISQPLKEAHLSIKEFSYNESKPILENIRFEILDFDQLFIMGYSGSGKSTIAKILAGKLKLSEEDGSYVFNEQKVREQEIFSDQSVLLASQNPYIFSGTIKENLLFGRSISSEDITIALKISCFDEVVNQYGLDYKLVEQGKNLSGGQRQRLSVCRALLRKPSLLILDEPSYALNKSTARSMIENIRAYYKNLGKSLVILTHDEDLVKNDDKILYL